VSSGEQKIYRLSLRGNRGSTTRSIWPRSPRSRTSHSDGRAYYERKIAEGKTHKERCAA
jgi:hypothetical protein